MRDVTSGLAEASFSLPHGEETETCFDRQHRLNLAPWRVRFFAAYIETHRDSPNSVKQFTAAARLSHFHFRRAFGQTFLDSPHGYLMRRRLAHSATLMLRAGLSPSQVAADCILADQAHLNKLIGRLVGKSPGAWRCARAAESPALSDFDEQPDCRAHRQHLG